MSTNLNELGNFANGALAGTAMIAAMQPVFTTKTYVMGNMGLPPRGELYRGLLPNCVAVAPVQGVNFVAYALALQYLARNPKNPTNAECLSAALVAGASGAPLATAFERVMIVQQMHKMSAQAAMQAIGWRAFQGLTPTVGREMLATAALFGSGDSYESKFTYGFWAGVASAPLDRIKTVMQGALHERPSFAGTTRAMWGPALWQGGLVRGALVGTALCCMKAAKDRIPSHLPGCMHRSSEPDHRQST